MRLVTRLKIERQRVYAWLRQTPYPPSRHGLAGISTLGLRGVESGVDASGGHIVDTGRVCMVCGDPVKARSTPLYGPGHMPARYLCPTHWAETPGWVSEGVTEPCVPVQDAAQEAARGLPASESVAANRQARELPLCAHGYYAQRCPTCLEEAP